MDQIRELYFQGRVLASGKTFDPGKLDRRHVCEASTGLVDGERQFVVLVCF